MAKIFFCDPLWTLLVALRLNEKGGNLSVFLRFELKALQTQHLSTQDPDMISALNKCFSPRVLSDTENFPILVCLVHTGKEKINLVVLLEAGPGLNKFFF